MEKATYYHGTSWPMYQQILAEGILMAPVYVTTDRTLARAFSAMRVRFHPDLEWKRRRVVLELDLTGVAIEPDPHPEANVPGTRYYGKLFRVMTNVLTSRVTRVIYYGFPQNLIDADLARVQQLLQPGSPF